jgi:hypothetical protein
MDGVIVFHLLNIHNFTTNFLAESDFTVAFIRKSQKNVATWGKVL